LGGITGMFGVGGGFLVFAVVFIPHPPSSRRSQETCESLRRRFGCSCAP
jgi:hypothetical protein